MFVSVNNVKFSGVASAVPKQTTLVNNNKFSNTTGVFERRISNNSICTSDLCFISADRLLNDLSIDRSDIELLVFVSQTPDYKLPVTSTILQNRLGLSNHCICLDIPLGCSGYVYGLYVASSLLSTNKLKKALLLVGDTISKEVDPLDSSTEPLFGDAGSATLLEFNTESKSMLFGLESDGAGFDSIIIKGGGCRNKSDNDRLSLNGADVFNFGVNRIPKFVDRFLENFNLDKSTIDLFVFHQANKFMNDRIYKKLNISENLVISSLEKFGNTSSATIPLTLVANKDKITTTKQLLCCGFGVGLSWGAVHIELTDAVYFTNLIEL